MAYVGITFSLIFLGLVIESFIVISSNNQVLDVKENMKS